MDDPREPDVSDVSDSSDAEDVAPLRREPPGAWRSAPSSIAAFVVSAIAMWHLPQAVFFFGDDWRALVPFVVPAASAAVGLWLTSRAEEEIFMSEGRLGGVGFCRASRAVSVLILVLCGLALVITVVQILPGGTVNLDV